MDERIITKMRTGSGPLNRLCLLNIYRSLSYNKTKTNIRIPQTVIKSRSLHCLCKLNRDCAVDTHRNLQCVRDLLRSHVTQHQHRERHLSKPADQPVINPIKRLQPFMAVPVIPPDEVLFDPSQEEIAKGEKLFHPDHKHKIEFLKSALYTEHLPQHDIPEVAFIGRSNVGKSSLIRAILGEVDINVRISSKPGHTKTLNFYQVGRELSLVDMPGYGYNMPKHFADSVEVFLHSRRNLKMTYLLVDGKVGMTSLDEEFANKLTEFQVNYCIVLTKVDKAIQSKLLKNFLTVLKYREQANFCFYQPFLTSAYTRDGISLLQTFIAYVTGNISVEGL